MRKAPLFLFFLCMSVLLTAKGQRIVVRGYITQIVSAGEFMIGDAQITMGPNIQVSLEGGSPQDRAQLQSSDIRVGTLVEVEGTADKDGANLTAETMKVFMVGLKSVRRIVLLRRPPGLERQGAGWSGTFVAEGRRIRVVPSTQVRVMPSEPPKAASQPEKKKKPAKKKEENKQQQEIGQPLESTDQISPITFLFYEGGRLGDASIEASRLTFFSNQKDEAERKLWEDFTSKVIEPDYDKGKAGSLKIGLLGNFKLSASREAQQYLQRVGESLISPFQKALPERDPNKIRFRFYLVEGKEAHACATPDGIVLVSTAMFEVLENEAQLTFVLAHELAHAEQEHSFRTSRGLERAARGIRGGRPDSMRVVLDDTPSTQFLARRGNPGLTQSALDARVKGTRVKLMGRLARSGYGQELENQATRLALESLLRAGYDPREAPAIWRQMSEKYKNRITKYFWGLREHNIVRHTYLAAEVRNFYRRPDPAKLKKNNEEFQRIAELVK